MADTRKRLWISRHSQDQVRASSVTAMMRPCRVTTRGNGTGRAAHCHRTITNSNPVPSAEEIGADVMIRVVDVLTSVTVGLGHYAVQESVRVVRRVNEPLPVLTRRPDREVITDLSQFASLWRTEFIAVRPGRT